MRDEGRRLKSLGFFSLLLLAILCPQNNTSIENEHEMNDKGECRGDELAHHVRDRSSLIGLRSQLSGTIRPARGLHGLRPKWWDILAGLWFLLLGDLTAYGYVTASFGSLSTRRRLEGISVNKEGGTVDSGRIEEGGKQGFLMRNENPQTQDYPTMMGSLRVTCYILLNAPALVEEIQQLLSTFSPASSAPKPIQKRTMRPSLALLASTPTAIAASLPAPVNNLSA